MVSKSKQSGRKTGHHANNGKDGNKYKYRIEIQQMMFVSGETNDPPESTTDLIEEIVRDQVVELLIQSQKTANSRGQRAISAEDVIFIIRHDKAKVNRLRTYLSWKDVRKNAKDQENGDIGTGNDLMDDGAGGNSGAGAGDASASTNANSVEAAKAKQKKSLRLPWELEFMFNEQALSTSDDPQDGIDEDERDAIRAQMDRLKQNDERTRNMTQQEYVHWSECRQASFTFRKTKRFREWIGMSQITETRPNDDVIDILGFLTFEMVCSITEEALKMKRASNDDQPRQTKKRRRYLFDEPDNDSRPIEADHVTEAWRRLQRISPMKSALYNFRGGRVKCHPVII